MKKLIISLAILLTFNIANSQVWTLDNVFTSSTGGDFGYAIDLNNDGTILAVGAYSDDSVATNAGKVQVFQKTIGGWSQIGNDIFGEASSDYFGYGLSLSADGLTLAVGAYGNDGNGLFSGQVKIFHFDGSDWTQVGSSIYGDSWESIGKVLSFNDDGTILAIGIPSNDDNGDDAGMVRVYQYSNGSWSNLGNEIQGEAGYDYFGTSVSLSADGNTLVVGADSNDGNAQDAGNVRVFHLNGNTWEQLGNTLYGDAEYDNFGHSVSVNSDGSIIAVGANNANSAHGSASLYSINSNSWDIQGSAIVGDNQYDNFGHAIALNQSGDRMAVGASGYAKVYDLSSNTLTQVGQDIHPQQTNDYFGNAISISADGKVLAVGGGGNVVEVFNLLNLPVVTQQPQNQTNICMSETVEFSIVADSVDSYKWQVSTDNGNNWIDINDNSIYSGATTNTLSFVADTSLNNNLYRCVLTNADGDVISNQAEFTTDNEAPDITCPVNTDVNANNENGTYTIHGIEFDLTNPTDNCGIDFIENDYNNLSTLDGVILPAGITSITWVAVDNAGNVSQCTIDINVGEYMAVENISSENISIYPNPFNEQIYLDFNGIDVNKLVLQDISGRTVFEKNISKQNLFINTTNIKTGVYILSIYTDLNIITKKIVKK